MGTASTLTVNGEAHTDFEFFRKSPIFHDCSNLFNAPCSDSPADYGNVNDDPSTVLSDGHTPFTFNSTGGINTPGDVIITVDYVGGGVTGIVDIRIWINVDTAFKYASIKAGRNFEINITGNGNCLEAYSTPTAHNFAYFEIFPKTVTSQAIYFNSILGGGLQTSKAGKVNATGASPWGSLFGSGCDFQDSLKLLQSFEFGINLTGLGLDISQVNPCFAEFGYVLIKTRSSQSFTSNQIDYLGPFPFADKVTNEVVCGPKQDVRCFGGSDGSVSASAGGDGTGFTYYWDNGQTTSVISNLTAGT
jgi:hypothetical protein